MLIYAPSRQLDEIERTLRPILDDLNLPFPVTIQSETVLYSDPSFLLLDRNEKGYRHIYTYAVQMSLKLLAAKQVRTNFYLTLDADLILLRPFSAAQLLVSENPTNGNDKRKNRRRAIYTEESRRIHSAWWEGYMH